MNWPTWLPLRENLSDLVAYGAPQIQAQAVLNTNENPYPLAPPLQNAITKAVQDIAAKLNRYPDRDATDLRESLAFYINKLSKTNFTSENIWAANGSNEIIQSIFLAFGSKNALGFVPSYSMHTLIAQMTGTTWIDGSRNPDFSFSIESAQDFIHKNRPTLTFITTPNNPTGGVVSIEEIQILANEVKEIGGLLIVDEAYAEFSDEISAVTLVDNNPHVVVIRTMSKAFAFAGARVGYLVSNPAVKDAMMIVRLPYHLSSLTQAVAIVAIKEESELLANVAILVAARKKLELSLHDLGLRTIPSSANFILFGGFAQESRHIWAALLEKGVLIRDVGLLGYLRVTVGNEAENALFISTLKELI